jgi:tetratricopeptide (TPR) repeat protein
MANHLKAGGAAVLAAMLFSSPAFAVARRTAAKRRPAGQMAAVSGSSVLVKTGLEALERKDYPAAIEIFAKAARAEGDGPTYFLLGYSHYQRGFAGGDVEAADKNDALETVNAYTTALALDPDLEGVAQPYKLYHSMGLSYEALGEYEKAVEAYRKAFMRSPSNPILPLYAARLRYRMNDVAKSASNLELSLKKARETGQLAALVKMLGSDARFASLWNSDENVALMRRFDSSFRTPQMVAAAASPMALTDGATLRDSVRGTTPAEDRGATMRRQDKDVLDQLSSANDSFKFRRYREAIAGYNEALTLNERSGILNPTQVAFVWERVGTSYNKLGLSGQAINTLRKCVQLAPMDAAAHYQLALAYALLGRYQESVHALDETFKSAPSTGELKRYMLLAKTDSELEGVRDLPAFRAALDSHGRRSSSLR